VRLATRLYRRLSGRLGSDRLAEHSEEMVALQERLLQDAWTARGLPGVLGALAAAGVDLVRQSHADRLPSPGSRRARAPRRAARALVQDCRLAIRHLTRNPAFSGVAVLTLALGVGAAASVFSVVDAVVLRPLPFDEPERLVRIRELTPRGGEFSTSDANFLAWREDQQTLVDVAAYSFGNRTWRVEGEARGLRGLAVSHSFFPVLRIAPVHGRLFAAEEDEPGGDTRVVLLSDAFWERAFGSDPAVAGRTIDLDGEPHRVAGVVPSAQSWPEIDVFTPLVPAPGSRDGKMLEALGRLAPGVSLDRAQDDLDALAAALAERDPDANGGWGVRVMSLRDSWIGPQLTRLGLVLLGAAGLLLLMTCATVSNLLLARAAGRGREVAIRAALGASRQRILRQLLLEGTGLGVLGTALGVAVCAMALPAVRSLGPADVPRLGQAAVDGRVLAVTMAAALLAVILASLMPALFATRSSLQDALRDGARAATPARRRLRSLLVAGQVATAVTLLFGAALLVRSFERLSSVELGFEPKRALRFGLSLPDTRFDTAARVRFVRELEARVSALAPVAAVGTTMSEPFGDFRAANFVAAGDDVPDRAEDFLPVSWRAVTPGFFEALEIRLVRGRWWGPDGAPPSLGDAGTGPPPPVEVVVDEALARALWPGREAVGESLVWNAPDGPRFRVIGITASIRDEELETAPRPRVYLSYALFPWPEPTLLVRARTADPWSVVSSVRAEIRELDPAVLLGPALAIERDLADVLAWPRFSMQVVGAFGVASLLLATLGLAGAISFAVGSRTREIGVRLALGASPRRVVWMIVSRGVALAAAGIAAGTTLALLLSRFLESVLFGVQPQDTFSFVAVAALVAVVALGASWWPARAAARIDPKRALAAE
jgi:predicted permease